MGCIGHQMCFFLSNIVVYHLFSYPLFKHYYLLNDFCFVFLHELYYLFFLQVMFILMLYRPQWSITSSLIRLKTARPKKEKKQNQADLKSYCYTLTWPTLFNRSRYAQIRAVQLIAFAQCSLTETSDCIVHHPLRLNPFENVKVDLQMRKMYVSALLLTGKLPILLPITMIAKNPTKHLARHAGCSCKSDDPSVHLYSTLDQ